MSEQISENEDSSKLDPWVLGQQYSQLLGEAPSSFTTLIRGLLKDKEDNNNHISFHHLSAMRRFLKGDSVRAPIYFYLKTFKPEMLNGEKLDPKEVVKSFKPLELAAVLGMLLAFRNARGKIKTDSEWKYLRDIVVSRAEIGSFIGYAIPNIGPGIGLIAGGIRFLGLAPFLIHDEKGYIEYRRHLKKNNLLCDFEYELGRWGCTHGHVAAHMLISLGFNRDTAIPIGRGLVAKDLPKESEDRLAYAARLVEVWTNSIVEEGEQPNIKHSGNFYPLEDVLAKLFGCAADTLQTEEQSQYLWMEKLKSDLTAESAPEFYVDRSSEQSSEQSDDDDLDDSEDPESLIP